MEKRVFGRLIAIVFGLLCCVIDNRGATPDTVPVIQAIGPDRKVLRRVLDPGKAPPPVQEAVGDAAPVPDRSIVQIETGMNYWNGVEWTPSDPTFDLTDDAFVAPRMQYKVRLDAELNVVGAVTVTTMDNVILKSTPIAIG